MFDVPGPITTTCVASGMALHMKTILLLLSSISVAYQLQICAVWGDKQGDATCVKANAAGAWNPRWWLDPKGIGSASEEAILATRRFPSVSIMDEDAAEVSTSNLAFCDRASLERRPCNNCSVPSHSPSVTHDLLVTADPTRGRPPREL